jgi:flagellar motor component MotA
MFSIIGIVVVFGAVVAGYLMERGNLKVLMQPAELIIILGAAIGTVLIANPIHILMKILSGIGGAFGGSPFDKHIHRRRHRKARRARENGAGLAEAVHARQPCAECPRNPWAGSPRLTS